MTPGFSRARETSSITAGSASDTLLLCVKGSAAVPASMAGGR
eukprot:CAMPEP_0114119040 /NCGR_PEP_ID=MMETSP0043_2-20121206/5901_1 /TAXON_ID=464988 /ORGANISM="Hemiselmis andersenii, Strain CCMP644" /LENGTH=41 /DNA_ID= /DNA_START= /DNA_END= /DNA_ORIENTATION=